MKNRKWLSVCLTLIVIAMTITFTGCGSEHNTITSQTATGSTVSANNRTALTNNSEKTASNQAENDNETGSDPVNSDVPLAMTNDKDITAQDNIPEPVNKAVYILNYHGVNDETFGIEDMFVRPSEFEKQMQFLKDNNYTVISFHDFKNVANIEKPVIITFDDGYEDNYTKAYPILQKYNFKATIFVCPEFFNKTYYLTTELIKSMTGLIDFQSHTLTHPDLTSLSDEQLDKELSESKTIIEQLTGQKVNALAYPTGYFDERVKSVAGKYYDYAVKIGGGIHYTGEDNMQMKRIYISRELDIEGFKAKLQ